MERSVAIGLLMAALGAAEQFPAARLSELLAGYQQGRGDDWQAVRISNAEAWESKRADIRARVLDVMGPFPKAGQPLDARSAAEERAPRYSRRKVSYMSNDGDRIPAWLLVPLDIAPGTRRPAILAAHETDPAGKDTVIGIGGREYDRYGAELAERGFVVLAPDSITAGERVLPGAKPYVTEPFDRAHPGWSAMGKMLADHRRGVDYLASLPFVDAARIGAIGHSLGAYNSYFLAAFDERVRAVVVSCGFDVMAGSQRPFAWARRGWFVHFPKLAPYLRAGILPFDFHEVLALAAPRSAFVSAARQDTIFPDPANIEAAAAQVRGVYALLGREDRLQFVMGDGPHSFPPAIRQQAYRWLEDQLR